MLNDDLRGQHKLGALLQGRNRSQEQFGARRLAADRKMLEMALEQPRGNYYDVVLLVIDEYSYQETKELVENLLGIAIPKEANIQIIRQPEGKIKGNWSAIINILMDPEHWPNIEAGLYANIAVILSAGTGSRNYPLTAAGYGDKGKQSTLNGRTYLEQQFRQIMQYFDSARKGMIIVSNDGIKAISKEVVMGDGQGIQFLGSRLLIRRDELKGLGMAAVDEVVATEGKPVLSFVEKAGLLQRIIEFYGIAKENIDEAEKTKRAYAALKQIEDVGPRRQQPGVLRRRLQALIDGLERVLQPSLAHERGDALPEGDFEQGAKGVDGGAVRLVGSYADGAN